MTPSLFIFGFGYSAEHLAGLAQAQGWNISGTSRSPGTRARLNALGYNAIDFTVDAVGKPLAQSTHLLISTPLSKTWEDPVLAHFEPIIRGAAPHLQWIGYLSTTGVYGDHQGAWIDETTPPKPTNDRAHGRLRAEAQWQALGKEMGVPAQVFRLAGIYGPGRNAIRALKEGTARSIYKQRQVFSRIHVDDIAQILMASMHTSKQGKIYNVCDDLPAPSHEVIEYAATLLGVPVPERIDFAQAPLSEMAREFYENSRRVRNTKIKEELKINLLYPTYRDGLNAMLEKGDY